MASASGRLHFEGHQIRQSEKVQRGLASHGLKPQTLAFPKMASTDNALVRPEQLRVPPAELSSRFESSSNCSAVRWNNFCRHPSLAGLLLHPAADERPYGPHKHSTASMEVARQKHLDSTVVLTPPTNRKPMNDVEDWLEGKRVDDSAEGLWRIHDNLYDLRAWVGSHPGGAGWLEVTRGTDITEAFECSHVSDKAEKIVEKFYVRGAKSPRHSLVTFHQNGFYRTLKRKIRERNLLPETKPMMKTRLFTDVVAVSVFTTALLGSIHNLWWAVASGVLLNMLAVCAHNFFHTRDNWRMHYFNLLLMSVRDWRISHVLSHHLYPNTLLDLEISMFEPVLRFLPREDKKLRYLAFVFCPVVMATLAHFQYGRRMLSGILSKKVTLRAEDFVCFSLFFFLLVFGRQGLWPTFLVWNLILVTGSFSFALVGLTAAHHHPDIYHEGDFLGSDKDFGLLQLAAVRNRADVDGNFMKTMVMFGRHALHHLFPTVDHGRLPGLEGVLEETCQEFKIRHKPLLAKNLAMGMLRQLKRNYLNSRLMILEN